MNEEKKSKVVGRDVLGAPDVEELKKRGAKLKASNDRTRARLTEVLSIAEKVLIKTVHFEGYKPGQYGQDYRDLGRAIAEIRTICRKDLSGDFPDYARMADMMTSEHFDPNRLAQELEAKASEKPVDYPTFYTPGWLCDLAKKLGATGVSPVAEGTPTGGTPVAPVPGCPSLMPLRIPGGFDGVEPAATGMSQPQARGGDIPVADVSGYEKFMTLPNGCRLVRFHGSDTIRLMTSRKGKNGNPNNVFEIFICKHGKRAYVRRDDMTLFAVEGAGVGYNIVESLAVSALKRYMKDRMTDNVRHKRRRAAKRAAANKALIEKELA